jgi:regulator of sigma D
MTTDNSIEVQRALRKARAVLNARFALRRAFEKIDYDLDVVKPALNDLRSEAAQGALPAFVPDGVQE